MVARVDVCVVIKDIDHWSCKGMRMVIEDLRNGKEEES